MIQLFPEFVFLHIFCKKYHETANFFKHANRDPDAVHEFYPEQTENVLFQAVYQYRSLTGEWSPEIRLFSTWYMLQHPKSFNTPPEALTLSKNFFGYDRTKFWRELLPLLQEAIDNSIIGPHNGRSSP